MAKAFSIAYKLRKDTCREWIEMMKSKIFEKLDLPSIRENGTHDVVNMRLSVELLKQICTS
jgi:hypothetical protein